MKKNEKHFTEETTLEELDMFIESLALKQFTYQGLIQAVGTLEVLDYYNKIPVLPDYQQPTKNNSKNAYRTSTKKIKKPIKWNEIENEAMIEGYRKFGLGEHKKVWEYHREIFEKYGHDHSKLKDHFRSLKTQPKYQAIFQSISQNNET